MDDEQFSVSTASREGHVVLRIRGELDLATAPLLEEALAAIEADLPVVVDMTGLAFVSCAGIRTLLDRPRARHRVLVVAPGSSVARFFDLLAATEDLPVCDDVGRALELAALASPERQPGRMCA